MTRYHRIDEITLKNKRVLLRLDLNVPLDGARIVDTTRIDQALPTIKFILGETHRLCIASHLGRPKGKVDPKYSLEPVARYLAEQLQREVILADNYVREPVDLMLSHLSPKECILLENLRFHDEEENNDSEFAAQLAKGIDVYVDDAFGAMHRAHASIVGVPRVLGPENCAVGFLAARELHALSYLRGQMERPYVVILGGAKVSDKIDVILQLIKRCNHMLFGGAMAYTLMHYMGRAVGGSKVETGKEALARSIMENARAHNVQLHFPVDHKCVSEFASDAVVEVHEQIPEGMLGVDIGPQTALAYADSSTR